MASRFKDVTYEDVTALNDAAEGFLRTDVTKMALRKGKLQTFQCLEFSI